MSEIRASHRSDEVRDITRWFSYEHLPVGLARGVSMSCAQLAEGMLEELPDNRQLVAGLAKLLEAKDCFVRAAIASVVPRPEGNSDG